MVCFNCSSFDFVKLKVCGPDTLHRTASDSQPQQSLTLLDVAIDWREVIVPRQILQGRPSPC